MSKVVGEGTYGCVHNPSLKCKYKKNIDYTDKISKVMTKYHADQELKEYKKIDSVDIHKDFFLGKPEYCLPKNTNSNMKAIDKCNNFESTEINNYKLLILKDGGINLDEFGKNIEKLKKTTENTKKMEKFWIEAHRLLYGLREMLENDIIHHDIKPHNIVYNQEKNRINLIDFGLMDKISNIKENCQISKHSLANPWWYFPFEIIFLNKSNFIQIANMSESKKINFIKKIYRTNWKDINVHQKWFYEKVDIDTFKSKNHDNFGKTFSEVNNNNYEKLLNKSLETFDIYGLGLSYIHILKKSKHLVSLELYNKLEHVFFHMITADLFNRYSIEECLNNYESALEDTILKKYNLYFKDNKLKKYDNTIQTVFKNISNTLTSFKFDKNDLELLKQNPKKKCNEGKEFNPYTKRCIKKCKKTYKRNNKFKCVKNKTIKSPYDQSRKH